MIHIPIAKILDIARHAPSGDNLQPWSFDITEDSQLILSYKPSPVKESDYHISGLYCSMGILIEYVNLAAASLGFATKVTINQKFDCEKDLVVASFYFSPDEELGKSDEIQSLISAIPNRHTVRAPFKKRQLTEELIKDLTKSLTHQNARVSWVHKNNVRSHIARFIKFCDKYLWEAKETRRALVESVFESKTEPYRNYGMPTSTLGVGQFSSIITKYFKLAQKIPLLWLPIKLKASSDATKYIYKSGAIGFIHVPKTKPDKITDSQWSGHDHIIGGRAVARFWLTATQNNLVLQPMYHFVAMIVNQENTSLGQDFLKANHLAMNNLNKIVDPTEDGTMVFAFRIGYPKNGSVDYPETPRYSVEDLCPKITPGQA